METATKLTNIQDVEFSIEPAIKTGDERLDKLLSKDGGWKKGTTILYSGTSGGGKSSTMVDMLKRMAVLSIYWSIEMAKAQLREQTKNFDFNHRLAYLIDNDDYQSTEDVLALATSVNAKFLVIDSIQGATQFYKNLSEEAAQEHVVNICRTWAKENDGVVVIIAHNTKEDSYKGNSYIKQMTDMQLVSHFNKKTNERCLYTEKNRKGPLEKLFYTFGETGIEFYDEEEWNSRTQPVDFQQNFITFVSNYIKKLNPQNETHAKFLAEYNEAKKSIRKMEDDQVCMAAFELVMRLSAKYKL